jgi:YD repeat-containing protein
VEYDYYDNGWLKTVTSPAGVSSFEYNTSGDILKITLPDGNSIGYMWYLDHSIRWVSYPDSGTVEAGYDLFGDVRWIEDAMGNRSGVRYDMLRQVSRTVKNLNGVEKSTIPRPRTSQAAPWSSMTTTLRGI